ncbi:ABC-F family ATP-binding cassette domain-containing protein [Pleomorphomonas sp. NRK KF1]|uniref:ABC-F family ATP-binding cassette domain-containing protein n=1 Tax=Pleomorphomonas sp. NRK KF1 TaxID=2943000 RepID=UPI002042E1A6|nr:ABC-F family ATP-binding cassette domain-containing protein [Pleomorphomonas sp. NRK KF1]MCM5551696.1 ATP-binding cassette domain-containing protein [Pleomorphomonas sp. NRK KF1]
MPVSITLSGLSYSTPDGRLLFDNLSIAFNAERTGLVGRNGVGKSTLLRLISGELAPRSGTIAVGGRLAVLRQIVAPPADMTVADLFGVADDLMLLERAEAGEASLTELAEADWTLPTRLEAALSRLGLAVRPATFLTALSGGEATRAALAALTFGEPDMLLLDEPTNNLDRDGRRAVIDLLAGWRGGAVVISHDRELLETMDAIVELTSLGAGRYGGGWSAYRARKAIELAAARHDLDDAERRLVGEKQSVQIQAEKQARRAGVGVRKAKKGDMPKIVAGGLARKAEETRAADARLGERRMAAAASAVEEARGKLEVLAPFSVSLPPSGLVDDRLVLRLDAVSVGYGDKALVRDLSLEVRGPERVAITGPNGSGKSTLLRAIIGDRPPLSGRADRRVDFAFLDQRVSLLDEGETIRDAYRRLDPGASEEACRASLARFKFRADAALRTVGSLSGGERLRAGLACVLGRAKPPQLLILDEPTNHLDVESIETVEAGLRAYDGALLVVSHDEAFLNAISIGRRIELASAEGGTRMA